jgi:beta-lactamase class A
MRFPACHLATALLLMACADHGTTELCQSLEARVDSTTADAVGVYFKDIGSGDSVLIASDVRMHAASMMKVPVMIQLFRDRDAGRLRLDDSITITKTFRSIVDGSPYDLGAPDDSDTTLYRRVGERESIRYLMDRMITVSSNLATNLLIELVGAERTQATMRELGADSIAVLRGVEDTKAYQAGLNNTTTARDLGVIFSAIAEGRAASPEACNEMIAILERQEFNEGIPAGLPAGVRVAHKTGWITGIRHDGGIVTLPEGRRFVLVVLTRGIADTAAADTLIADVARRAYEFVAHR